MWRAYALAPEVRRSRGGGGAEHAGRAPTYGVGRFGRGGQTSPANVRRRALAVHREQVLAEATILMTSRAKRGFLWILKNTLNRATLRSARRGRGPYSLVRHVGQKSGAVYETPFNGLRAFGNPAALVLKLLRRHEFRYLHEESPR